jgi:hypothetical protein
MKKLILTAAMFSSMTSLAIAQDAISTEAVATTQAQDPTGRVKVEEADLPEGVKKTLATESYKEWKLEAAWLVTEGSAQYYVIELSKGEERKAVRLNKEGEEI